MNDGSPRQQIVDSIKSKSNILVTVSTSPSVDELSAALGLTILLNNLGKRATAVVSGTIPPAITFLEPENTFEDTASSLQDFIIALDKEKADHLRYKVDGDVVKIFITPYRTVLSEKDLEFSQGEYNVELIIALGVKDQNHLDKALDAHGRILHDATVATICAGTDISTLGGISWQDDTASSLCEMLVGLSEALKEDKPVLDEQISTAFLTGIVSSTDRFSNNKTSSRVMTMAAQLMAAGANQQLIAAKLQEGHEIGPDKTVETTSESDLAPVAEHPDGSLTLTEEPTKLNTDRQPAKKSEDAPVTDRAADPAAESIEDQLTKSLETIVPAAPPVVDEITQELTEPTAASVPEPVAELPVVEAPTAEPPQLPVVEPLPSMPPELELSTLGTLPPAPTADITMTHTSGYVGANDQQSGGVTPNSDGEMPSIDPFAAPMATSVLPTIQPDPLFETQQGGSAIAAPIAPPSSTEGMLEFEETPIPPDPAAVAAVPDFTSTNPTGLAMTPASSSTSSADSLPPLPPLPDFSTLPPPPPGFSMPADSSTPPTLDANIPSPEQLGEMFAPVSTPPPGVPPVFDAAPPPPGQFKIPGQ